MLRSDQIITQARRQSDNERVSSTAGISDEEAVFFLTSLQTHLQSYIFANVPNTTLFDDSYSQTPVVSQRAYSITSGRVLGQAVRKIEYSSDSAEQNYYPLERAQLHELWTGSGTYPTKYSLRGSTFLVSPIPDVAVGTLRSVFVKQLDDLDIRRGKVSSTANNGTSFTTIELAATPTPSTVLEDTDYYICVVDKDGTMLYRNIPVSSYNSSSRVLTLDSGVVLTGGTIPANSYVVYGKNKTTHSQLPDICERFLIEAVAWKLQKRDSSIDSIEANQELADIRNDIIQTLQSANHDIHEIPITNDFYTF